MLSGCYGSLDRRWAGVRVRKFGLLDAEEVALVPQGLNVVLSLQEVCVGSPASPEVTWPVHSQVTLYTTVWKWGRYKVQALGEDDELIRVQRLAGKVKYRVFGVGPGRSQCRKLEPDEGK